MLVVDASCLFETLIGGQRSDAIGERLAADPDHAAPHVVDVEVFGVVRREHQHGRLDRTEAAQAVEDLEAWPGERFGHRLLLPRAWELCDTVRGWDAMYVALAGVLEAVLITTDHRLAAATGPICRIDALSRVTRQRWRGPSGTSARARYIDHEWQSTSPRRPDRPGSPSRTSPVAGWRR